MKPGTKFEWIWALAADPRIADSTKFIGIYIALRNLDPQTPTFRVRQSTVAANCATSIRTVKRAYRELREYGWIELHRRRSGTGGADQYVLNVPELGDNLAPSQGAKSGQGRGQNRSTKGPNQVKVGDTTEALTSGNGVPKGIYKGFEKGFREGTALSADPHPEPSPNEEEPLKFCSKHPVGTTEPCQPCGDAKAINHAWKEERAARQAAADAAIRALIDNCDDCDSYGRDDDLNDCPKHPNFRRRTA